MASIPRQRPHPQFVGRKGEIRSLTAALDEIADGQGMTLTIAGDAGIGKSALLRRFLGDARATRARLLVGECTEIEARRPFGPFIEALTSAGIPLSKEQGDPSALGQGQRYRAHAAFFAKLKELAERHPVVLAIEDVHWADESSLELITYLAERIRTQSVLFVFTYRRDELHRRHPLNHALAELARRRLVAEISLARLDRDEATVLMRGALGGERNISPSLRDRVDELCEGNPFCIEELVRSLVERRDITSDDVEWRLVRGTDMALPKSVRETILERVSRLRPEDQRILQIAAVIGNRFEFDLLREVANVGEADVLAAIRNATEAQLVSEVPLATRQDIYAFRHALTREAVLGDLLQRERRLLHRSIARALEARPSGQNAEELAYHFDAAGDPEPAFRYHDLASDEAIRVFAFARAVAHLERALELAPDGDPAIPRLYRKLVDVVSYIGDAHRAIRAAEQARAALVDGGDRSLLGWVLVRLAMHRLWVGESERAMEHVHEAIAILEPLGPTRDLAGAYMELSREYMLADRGDEAIEWGERAISVATQTDALVVELMALITIATVRAYRGEAEGIGLLRECIVRSKALFGRTSNENVLPMVQRAYGNLVEALFAEASGWHEAHEEQAAHARQFGLSAMDAVVHTALVAFSDGRWDEVLALREVAPPGTWSSAVCDQLAQLVTIARSGPPPGGVGRDVSPHLLPSEVPNAHAVLGITAFIAGQFRDVRAHREAIEARGANPRVNWIVQLVPVVALEAELQQGDERAIEACIAAALREEPAVGAAYGAARRAYAKAVLAARTADPAARSLFAESAAVFDELPFGALMATLARLRRAELILPHDRREALAEFARGLAFWERANAAWYLEQLRAWGKDRGLTVAAPGATKSRANSRVRVRLTSREREVATLVAAGLTNREIGERLSIAERSAEGHVERIRNKLGVRSRAQIAAWIGAAEGPRR